MKRFWKHLCSFTFIGGFMALFGCTPCNGENGVTIDNSTIASFDLNRFLGKWYEVARYEHRFERDMTHVTAEYSLREDGKIKVVNKGVKDGKAKEIIGKAKQPDPINHPGKLKVSFFLWFYSDYYIMELDENYQYAVIGSSTDKYLWILSRTPELPYDTVIDLVNRLQQRGYDTEKLTWVQQ